MDFKSMLQQLSQLSEGTQETEKGRVHKADPGGYGRKFDTDEEGDENKDDKKAAKKDDAPKKRGRPPKTGEHSKSPEEKEKQEKREKAGKDLQSFMVGNLPKDKKGKPALPGKPGKKHSLKEWVQEIEAKYIAEEGPMPTTSTATAPKPGQKVLVKPGQPSNQKPPATITTQTGQTVATGPADQVKKLGDLVNTGQVTLTKPGTNQPLDEEGEDKKWIKGAVKHPGAFTKKARAHDMTPSAFASNVLANKEDYPAKTEKQANLAKTLGKLRKKTTEADVPPTDSLMSPISEEAKPDFPDIDDDGNKKEPISKAAKDAEKKSKKKVNESAHKHNAARLLGKHHALAKESYNCKYDDMEESRMYHEGYKEGLDECYGQMPVQGLVSENPMPATVPGMANASMSMPSMEEDMFDEGNAFTAALAKTGQGERFTVGGKTFTDRSGYDADLDETFMAFENWDKELNDLLNEGMTVSISKGQQGSPDSVSVSAQDAEADQLLGLIKQAGLGLFGGEDKPQGFSPDAEVTGMSVGGEEEGRDSADIGVVDDHDDMMALIKKVLGGEQQPEEVGAGSDEGHDYEGEEAHDEHDHEGHDHSGHEEVDEESCNECGMLESSCECEKEPVEEVESYDQEEYEVAEDNAPDSDAAETTADEDAEASEDQALAKADELNEWANDVGKKGTDEAFDADIAFMTKVISGGLNKEKATGQTTIPVIPGQNDRMGYSATNESVSDWKKLAGIK